MTTHAKPKPLLVTVNGRPARVRPHPAVDVEDVDGRRFAYVSEDEVEVSRLGGLRAAMMHAAYTGDRPWTTLYAVVGGSATEDGTLTPVRVMALTSALTTADDYIETYYAVVDAGDPAPSHYFGVFSTRIDGRA